MKVDVRAITRSIQKILPEALDEPFLRETWAGAHGRLGMRNVPHAVTSHITLGERELQASAGMFGRVVDRSGTKVGEIERFVSLAPNGHLDIEHWLLKLDPAAQQHGFARSLNKQAFSAYATAGIDDVHLVATREAGGYVWAREGFELAPFKGAVGEDAHALNRAKQLRTMVRNATQRDLITPAQQAKLAPRMLGPDNVMKPDTLSSIVDLAHMDDIGKSMLLGDTWNGVRAISPPKPWWSSTGARDATEAMETTRALVANELPDALNPSALRGALEKSTAAGKLRLIGSRDAEAAVELLYPGVTTTAPMSIIDDAGHAGGVVFTTKVADDGRLVATRTFGSGGSHRQLNASTNRMLRDMGVEQLTSRHPHPNDMTRLVSRT
jgi:hypothetical protein